MTTPSAPDPDPVPRGVPQDTPGAGTPVPTPEGHGVAPRGSGAPADPAAQRPVPVRLAAVLGFLEAALLLLASLAYFTFASIVGFLALFGALFLLLAVACIWGATQALQGKDSRMLTVAAGIAAGLALLAIGIAVAGGAGFDTFSLLVFLLGAGTVVLLLQPASRQYFAARRAQR
jgi:hypothetical protein